MKAMGVKIPVMFFISFILAACGPGFEKTVARAGIDLQFLTDTEVAAAQTAVGTGSSSGAGTGSTGTTSTKLVLVTDRFWDTANGGYAADTRKQLEASLKNMPGNLKNKSLSAKDRAAQLQWAFKAANESNVAAVEIWVQQGDYDFSSLKSAHVSTPASASHYLPKLYIGRNNVTVVARHTAKPRFYFSGAGADGIHHGRVLLMVKSKLSGVKIERIDFQGDHAAAKKADVSYYVHENNSAILGIEPTKTYSYGLLMIGYEGGENGVTVDGCRFTGINHSGISLVGNAVIKNSVFKSIIGEPAEGFSKYYASNVAVYDAVNARMGFVGMAFLNGIRLMNTYGSLQVTGSSFQNLVEGIVGVGIGGGSRIDDNTFSTFADHAIYLLGPKMPKSSISRNRFEKSYGSALKLAGWAGDYGHPLDASGSYQNLTIQENIFKNVLGAKIEMMGTFNTIRDNQVYMYDYSGDANGYYNPAREGDDTNGPDFWFGHYSGGDGFWNHFSFNKVENNRVVGNKRLLQIFLHHDPTINTANDRSIGFNYFSGSQQYVSYRHQLSSWSAPLILLNSSQLTLGTFTNCVSCKPDATGFRRDITIEWSAKVRAGSSTAYLVKYTEGSDIYLISPDGIHERVNPYGRAFDVFAIADLDGDGYDEVYSREHGGTKLYGGEVYRPGYLAAGTLDQWVLGDPGSAMLGWSVVMGRAGSPGKLYAVFAHASNRVYSSTPRADGLVHIIGDVYSYSGGVNSLPAGSGSWGVTAAQFMAAAKSIFDTLFAKYTK